MVRNRRMIHEAHPHIVNFLVLITMPIWLLVLMIWALCSIPYAMLKGDKDDSQT